jgi:hypothetical protein
MNRFLNFLVLGVIGFFGFAALAQVAAPVIGPAELPGFLTKLFGLMPPAKTDMIVFVVGGISEVILGLIKSEKPLRLAYAAAKFFNMLGAAATSWGQFMDKVLPQNVKSIEPAIAPPTDKAA